MRKLIVNADDFGLTPGVCAGIVQGHEAGIVTSTTLLINSPHLPLALEMLKNCATLDLGLHLNITWGKPILSADNVKTLVDGQGMFIRNKNFELVDPVEVENEWDAQIEKAHFLGLHLTHLDTHHHTHLHPALLDLLPGIAEREKLAVRSPASWVKDFFVANAVPTPAYFIIDFYGEGKTSVEHLQNFLRFIPEGTTELMCHPALVDDALRQCSSYHEERGRELETLTSSALKNWLSGNEIALSSFGELLAQHKKSLRADPKTQPPPGCFG